MEKNKTVKKPTKSTKTATKKTNAKKSATTTGTKKKKKKKGFTLIELLAVIIILGILMIIAIPSVTSYISNSRKNAYIDTAKELVAGARNKVNEGNLEMYATDTTYYIPSSYIKTEGGEAESPYGKFVVAYIGIIFNGKGYKYYWISVDDAGEGIDKVTPIESLDTDDIKSNLNSNDILNKVKTTGIGNRPNIKILNSNGEWDDYSANTNILEESIDIEIGSFSEDSWETISKAIKAGLSNAYHVGDTKEVDLGSLGVHTVRVINSSTPNECDNSNFSQSSCGFVIEFTDIIEERKMSSSSYNTYGWGYSSIRTYLNEEFYESLPSDLKNVIINTYVVYGTGTRSTSIPYNNVTDKIFILSAKEITNSSNSYDMADPYVRQLDYYASNSNNNNYKKKYGNFNSNYWTRSADHTDDEDFIVISYDGSRWYSALDSYKGVVPAFRIG